MTRTFTWCAYWLLTAFLTPCSAAESFAHPGALHSQADIDRMKSGVSSQKQPWLSGWGMLIKNQHSSLSWKPHATEIIYRGADGNHIENYSLLFNDAAAAYALALRWKVSGDKSYADHAVMILDSWASTLNRIDGASDKYLAAGIYGYQLANAAEILRTYKQWPTSNFNHFRSWMIGLFYKMNHDFLLYHNGAKDDHYWANWDLANMSSMIAIGILADRRDIYDEALNYFKYGKGNGAIEHAVWKIYPYGLAQTQESGRDQGHNTLNVAFLGVFCQMAWNQSDDLFSYQDNRVLKGIEYVARYNLGMPVPFTTYKNSDVVQTAISDKSRGNLRPVWELFYNHYVVLKKLNAPYTSAFARKLRPEGGGGDYGPNSGGFDQLGYGTLTYTLK